MINIDIKMKLKYAAFDLVSGNLPVGLFYLEVMEALDLYGCPHCRDGAVQRNPDSPLKPCAICHGTGVLRNRKDGGS